jgi:hypothetical protein
MAAYDMQINGTVLCKPHALACAQLAPAGSAALQHNQHQRQRTMQCVQLLPMMCSLGTAHTLCCAAQRAAWTTALAAVRNTPHSLPGNVCF